jgi:hypothetical protein
MTTQLRAAATTAASFRHQAWLLGVSGRWIYPAAAVVALLLLVGRTQNVSLLAAIFAVVLGSVWPLIVWHAETPGRRLYHWSLPVTRAAHDLMRVATGALYLVVICAVFGATAAISDGTLAGFTARGPQAWSSFFLVPLILYFVVTPLALWSEYAITRWTLGSSVAFAVVAVVLELQGVSQPVELIAWALADGRWSFTFALTDGIEAMDPSHTASAARWAIAAALWLGFGIAWTIFTAIFRPDDLKRMFATRWPGSRRLAGH